MVQDLVVPPSLPLILAGQAAYHLPNLADHHPHLAPRGCLQMGLRYLLADLQPLLDLEGLGECTLTG